MSCANAEKARQPDAGVTNPMTLSLTNRFGVTMPLMMRLVVSANYSSRIASITLATRATCCGVAVTSLSTIF